MITVLLISYNHEKYIDILYLFTEMMFDILNWQTPASQASGHQDT